MPAEVRYCDPSSPPYDVLARMQPRQYEPGCLFILMEKITIRDEDYHAWRRSHQKGYARPGSQSDDTEHGLDPTKSGMPGRPSPKHLYLKEMKRRAKEDLLQDSLAQEARDLWDWMDQKHPELNRGRVKSIENVIRDDYRRLQAAK